MQIPPLSFSRPQRDFKQMVQTTNVDAQDHYTEIHALFEQNDKPITALTESSAVQAVPTTRRRPTQCQAQEFANRGVQYEPQLFAESKLMDILGSKEYKQFFDKTQTVLKNALIANHVADAEFALQVDEEEYEAKGQSTLNEIQTLQNALSKGKTITSTAVAQYLKQTLVFEAVAPPNFQNKITDTSEENLSKYHVLVWNVADNMQPLGMLVAPSAVTSMDVIDQKGHLIVVCGTLSGQVLIYDLDGIHRQTYEPVFTQYGQIYNTKNLFKFTQALEKANLAEYYPSITSSPVHFHQLAVTDVRWLPPNSQITRSGDLQTSANQFGSIQFASVSPDGFIKVFSLMCFDKDPTRNDQVALIPFLQLPMSVIFPNVRQIKPVSIQFMHSDLPSSLFIVGDAFGSVCFSTWPVAVAGLYALEDDKKKLEKQYLREVGDQQKGNLERLDTFYQDHPSRGTLVSGFQSFLGPVFHLEFNQSFPALLMGAAPDGVKMWLMERKMHRQTMQYSMRGLVEEQVVMQQSISAARSAGFVVASELQKSERKFQAKQVVQESGFENAQQNKSIYKQLITPQQQFVELSALLTSLNLSLVNVNQQQQPTDISIAELNKRCQNMNGSVARSFEADFANYSFYEPVFNYLLQEGSLTSACMSQVRPSVVFLGTDKGVVLVFDLNDRMYEPLIQANVCVGLAITSMKYVRQAVVVSSGGAFGQQQGQQDQGAYQLLPEKKKIKSKDVIVLGDCGGNVHVLEVPKSLRHKKQSDAALRNKFRKCLEGAEYGAYRRIVRAAGQAEEAAQSEQK